MNEFLKKALSEKDGTPSSRRLNMIIAVVTLSIGLFVALYAIMEYKVAIEIIWAFTIPLSSIAIGTFAPTEWANAKFGKKPEAPAQEG